MAIGSEGEFELVLGNRQLFSVLGIVVILLGIFFAMGFFAGKSVGQASANSTAARPIDQPPLVVDSPQNAPTASAPPSAVPAAAEPATTPDKDAASKVEEKRASHETKEAVSPKKQEASPAKPAPSKGSDQVVKPAPGSYLQVASTRLSEAQSLSALLRKHQFHVVLAESPKAELIRVLVGPFSSAEATTEARAKLKSLDIAKPYPVKYPPKD
jgi:septal ring-binding cell division protein DamX